MITPDKQMATIIDLCRRLSDKTGEYRTLMEARAEKERVFNIALASKMLALKEYAYVVNSANRDWGTICGIG